MPVEVINISKDFEPILAFLYPNYSFVDNLFKFSNFIIRQDITTKMDRERLDFRYNNAVFLSDRIFDEVWDADMIRSKVLQYAQTHFRSRKKVFRTINSEGPAFVAECLDFMFFGLSAEEVQEDIDALFKSLGSQTFFREFMMFCEKNGIPRTISAVETFISKVLSDSESLYYKRAKVRLGGSLLQNVRGAIIDSNDLDPYFKKHFPDLCKLRFYTQLLKREYEG